MVASSPALARLQVQQSDAEQVIATLTQALPDGWAVIETSPGAYPYGHYYCGGYDGPDYGTKLTITGPQPVYAHWTDEAGTEHKTAVAVEALEVWLMPLSYHDSNFAWFCFHRPVQPLKLDTSSDLNVYARSAIHLLSSDLYAAEVLAKATQIWWPNSPEFDPEMMSWTSWENDIASALADNNL